MIKIAIAADNEGDVLGGLAFADGDVGGGEVDRVPAELGHTGFERDASTQRGFLEDHRQGFAGEQRVGLAAETFELERVGGMDDLEDFLG
jgi:hypothetical protein